ncbi:MAG: extracellular solute-binding protein [Clostridiales bacterium]|nr:extracellular solute-binding protein [Clostridiales bacterium]
MNSNITKKAGALIVSGLLILSEAAIFAGCKKKNEAGVAGVQKISKDSPWYDATISEIQNTTTNEEIEYIETDIIGAYHDGILVRTYGEYKLPDDFDINTSRVGYEFDNLDYYDANGKLVNSIDLYSFVTDVNAQDIGRILLDGDSVYLYREDCDLRDDGNRSYYLASLDIETGVVGEFEKLPYTDKEIAKTSFCFPEETLMVGDYLVSAFQDGNTAKFVICNNGQRKIAALPDTDLGIITGCLNVSEKEIVFICSYGSVRFLSLNLENGSIQNKDEEYSWMNTLTFYKHISSFEGKSYFTAQDGIKRINFETKQFEDVVSFDNCNLNRDDMDRLSLCSVNGDKYILAGDLSHGDLMNQFSDRNPPSVPTIVTLERNETNPHAGKVIITAAAVGNAEVPYSICEAIRIFNDTNEDYFVRLTYNYDIRKSLNYGDADEDEAENIYLKTAADLNDLLAINMLAGDGPDIILNAGDIRQIHTEAHLVNLNNYVEGKKGINTDDYFSNVIDAAKIDGKLLFMPVSFSVSGLLVNKDDVRDDQVGFTYEEYVDFVNEKCGGNDPMVDTRLGVLCTLFSNMSDTCIQDNTVNFDNESFRKLCEYVKKNVPEHYGYNYDFDGNESYGGLGGFLQRNTYMSGKKTLVGYPSQDASGPVVSVDTSIGISAYSPSAVADGAWEFIKTCLSDEVQEVVALDHTNPVSKSVFDSTARMTLENYNISPMSFGIAMDESVIDSYKEVLQSASVLETEDPAVLSVIREEMPAYFLDQKSLDAVLEILNNRVTTIINERGHS